MAGRDWKRLASYVIDARTAAGFPVRRTFAKHIVVSDKTLQRLELDHMAIRPAKLAAIERGVGWAPGSAEAVLAGGEPTLLAGVTHIAGPDLRDDTERQLWALPDLSDEERWAFIDLHRAHQVREHRRFGE
ncbi:hypothetical protein [Amycolatopsis eburnea]|uniref:Uncharacterized protein n=1 Tax=Amycolatopsis eburnea TaxID=2267691 RepID=A0A3R9E6S3_9PSEU|nr:hypothetical protein [Amycolatopsis eburnea]RSD21964.1 hypothetical protein EIY87_09100 [Amycolatopsis eburnea]